MPNETSENADECRYTIVLTRATRQALKVRAAQEGVSLKRLLLRFAVEAGVDVADADLQDTRAA